NPVVDPEKRVADTELGGAVVHDPQLQVAGVLIETIEFFGDMGEWPCSRSGGARNGSIVGGLIHLSQATLQHLLDQLVLDAFGESHVSRSSVQACWLPHCLQYRQGPLS